MLLLLLLCKRTNELKLNEIQHESESDEHVCMLCCMGIGKIQGELVDSVEHHVESTTDYIKRGHLELEQAQKYQSKARKVFTQLFRPFFVYT